MLNLEFGLWNLNFPMDWGGVGVINCWTTSLSLQLLRSFFDNVHLEHGGLLCSSTCCPPGLFVLSRLEGVNLSHNYSLIFILEASFLCLKVSTGVGWWPIRILRQPSPWTLWDSDFELGLVNN